MGQLKLILSFIFIGLFTISILGYAINFGRDNDAAVKITDDDDINTFKIAVIDDLDDFGENTEDSYESMLESSVTKGDTLESGGVISLTISDLIGVTYNILNVGYKKIFGDDEGFGIYFTVFMATILMMFAMYFLKTWLGRNPD